MLLIIIIFGGFENPTCKRNIHNIIPMKRGLLSLHAPQPSRTNNCVTLLYHFLEMRIRKMQAVELLQKHFVTADVSSESSCFPIFLRIVNPISDFFKVYRVLFSQKIKKWALPHTVWKLFLVSAAVLLASEDLGVTSVWLIDWLILQLVTKHPVHSYFPLSFYMYTFTVSQ